ncbi:MAG: hypothetical protein PHX44_09805 [Sulfurimonas sp.]|uniref:hypothetical protein n=1 Tax=Sulfurimonas sp. TaxID=2022749 RepID=UPI002615EBC7|nr:hypothetical protein [Sulfurimonas sp.]MDD2653326.1 hypothetical protein [Sulfurimonas sp.]MDD3450697.1 hypothetical protein [Sulfurimonas sp.]
MNRCKRDEIEALNFNLNVLVEKSKCELSIAGATMAKELILTLKKVKSMIEKKEARNIELICSTLPLLYFQIPTIK